MKLRADRYGRVPFAEADLLDPDFDRAAQEAYDTRTVDAEAEARLRRVLDAALRSPYVRGRLTLPPGF